jgi:diacylglycerol kinase family enzyme
MPADLPNLAENVLILRNPKSGVPNTQARVERLAELLHKRGLSPEIHTELQTVTEKALELHAAGNLRVLVGVGGDGTAAELVNRTPEGLPLTLLPGGNENLLARHLGLRPEPEKLAETIARGKIARFDAGRANGRIFLLMIGCGIDAEVVRLVHECRTGPVRSRDYLKPFWEVMRTYEYPKLQVYCDEAADGQSSTVEESLRWLAAFNFPCYGGGLPIAPQADSGDGMLDFCGYRCAGSFARMMMLVAAIYARQQKRLSGWTTRKFRRMRIESDQPVPYQLDGDPGGMLPVEIEVLPQRLTLMLP